MDDDDPLDGAYRRHRLLAELLADRLRDSQLSDADRRVLEAEYEREANALWDTRQRLFDRDATGQDEEVFYERFGLSGESYPRNDAGEYLGLM